MDSITQSAGSDHGKPGILGSYWDFYSAVVAIVVAVLGKLYEDNIPKTRRY